MLAPACNAIAATAANRYFHGENIPREYSAVKVPTETHMNGIPSVQARLACIHTATHPGRAGS